jgi:SecD-like export protein
MKHCPTCKRTYVDELRFCLEDGASLTRLEPSSVATLTMPAQNLGELQPTLAYEAGMSSSPTAAAETRSYKRWVIIGALVTIGLVSAASWYIWSTTDSVGRQTQTAGGSRLPTEFRLAESVQSDGLTEMTAHDSDEKVYLHTQPIITSEHIASATVVTSQLGDFQVAIVLTEAGGEILRQVTSNNINKRMGIVVGRELLTAPIIHDPVSGGRISIQGGMTEAEARRLAEDIMGK